jgi:type IV pilus assembly protein PilM
MKLFDFAHFPIYALDLSDQSFKFLHLTDSSDGIVVTDFGEGEIDKGTLENGEIKDKNRLSEILKDVFYENSIKYIALSLPEEKGFLREIRISGVNEGEIASALEFQIEEHIPLKASEIFFDYIMTSKGSDYFDLVITAFPKIVIESYLDIINISGALPVYVESELKSAARSIMPKDFLKPAMVVDWGKTRASFSVFENGILSFASTALVGGDMLDKSISKNLQVSKSKALKIKLKADIMNSKDSPEVLQALLPVISELADEIKKILDYWQNRSGVKTHIEQIFLSGGDSNLFGLGEYLQKKLGVSVKLANPWVNINFPPKYLPPIKYSDSLRFSSAIGLSLRTLKEEKII